MTKATHKSKDLGLWFMGDQSPSWGIVTAGRTVAEATI